MSSNKEIRFIKDSLTAVAIYDSLAGYVLPISKCSLRLNLDGLGLLSGSPNGGQLKKRIQSLLLNGVFSY